MDDIEYSYKTKPSWAMDAIVCTETGVELNFEKLSLLCPTQDLPAKITIELVNNPYATSNNNGLNNSIQNGVKRNGYDNKNGHHISSQSLPRKTETIPPKQQTMNKKKELPRSESIIQREIRLQREREEELRRERQLLTGLDVQTNVTHDVEHNEKKASVKYSTEHPIKIEMNRAKQREAELRERRQSIDSTASSNISLPTTTSSQDFSPGSITSPTNSYTPVYSTPDIKARKNSKIASPLHEEETKSSVNWFLNSESPVNRDIRIAQQREQELKKTRRESVFNST